MSVTKDVKRAYRSDLREDRANQTRQQIVRAAHDLFIERGYVATSIETIAAAAGVGRATVFTAVGGKPALMKEAYELAVLEEGQVTPSMRRDWLAAIDQVSSASEILETWARSIVMILDGIAPICESLRTAASSDDELRALYESIQKRRRGGAAKILARVETFAPLRAGLARPVAVDTLWALTDPATYRLFVIESGWSSERFANWLASSMKLHILNEI